MNSGLFGPLALLVVIGGVARYFVRKHARNEGTRAKEATDSGKPSVSVWLSWAGVVVTTLTVLVALWMWSPDLTEVGGLVRKHWLIALLLLAALYGYGFATTKLPAPATAPGAVPSRWRVVGMAAMPVSIVLAVLLGAAALWSAWSGPSSPSVTCRSAAPEVRNCALSTEWSNWIQPTEGVANGLHFCGIPAGLPSETRVTQGGTTLMRFRAPMGTVEFRYYLAPTAACEIPGKL